MATRRAYAVQPGCGRLCDPLPGLCRDCLALTEAGRCATCDGTRIVRHHELFDLTIAHIDCDAFYASVEKRD